MNVQLQQARSTSNPTETVLIAARGDYMSESIVDTSFEEAMADTDKSTEELVADLLRKGHFGPFEHPTAFFAVEGISRVTMAQITRHRHMSFDVQSMRYVPFEDSDVTVPPSTEETESELRQYFTDPVNGNVADQLRRHYNESVERYQEAVDAGVPKEDARFFLPLGTQVNMTFSANIRTLLHVLDLRHSGKAQWEVRQLAEQIIEELREWCPIVVEQWEQHVKNASLQSP